MGVTHDGTVRCLSRGNRTLATPPDLHAATGAVLASIPRVYAVWYAVVPAPGSPPRGTGAAPAAPIPPRRGRRHNASMARGPRACVGVAAAPQGAGSFSRAVTLVCGHRAAVRRGYRDPPSPPPPHLPHPPTHPTARRQAYPPPACGRGRECTTCMSRRYAELSGQPSSAPQVACEPEDRPSNQIKSNQASPPPPRGGGVRERFSGFLGLCRALRSA